MTKRASFPLVKKELSSGLRVLLLPRSEGETVTLLVLIGVGSRYEAKKQSGLSHFLEHMFFKGTKTRPDKREIAEAMDNIGAEFNAFTGEEVTGYYVKAAREHLDLGADVVSDILLRSLFPAEEIERERGVIKEEIKMYTDSPMQHVHHLWRRALFGKQPLGRRIDGSAKTVSAFQRSDFVSYTKKHYHTGNAVVALAGNFDSDEALDKMQLLFKELPQGEETEPEAAREGPAERLVHERRESLDQTHLVVGVPGVSLDDDRRFAANLLAIILGGGMSSRLFMKVREKEGLAYAIRSSIDNFVDTGSLETQAGLRTDRADFALKLILQEYDRVMQEVVPAAEINKVKQMVRGHMVLELEETNSLAMFAGVQELLQNKVMTPHELWQRTQAVTAQDIQRVAQDLLSPGRRAAALLSPHESVNAFEQQLKTE
ncbi:MAG: pitrilysin family protein [bacterium]